MSFTEVAGNEKSIHIDVGFRRFSVCIPSRKREQYIVKNPLLPIANVFVHESEVDSYVRHFEDNGVAYGRVLPHTRMGLPNIRNDMIERVFEKEDDWIFMCDDDVVGMSYLASRTGQNFLDLDTFLSVMTSTGNMACEMEAGIFGFHQTGSPQERSMLKPFDLRVWTTSQGWGITDRTLRYDPGARSHDDLDLCLQCIAKNGYILRDNRWYVKCNTSRHGALTGGLAGTRSTENEREEVAYLMEKWGDKVISPKGSGRGAGITIGVIIPK